MPATAPGALAAYDRLSDRLRGALGLAPSAQTRSLAAAIREDGVAIPPRPTSRRRRPPPRPTGRRSWAATATWRS